MMVRVFEVGRFRLSTFYLHSSISSVCEGFLTALLPFGKFDFGKASVSTRQAVV